VTQPSVGNRIKIECMVHRATSNLCPAMKVMDRFNWITYISSANIQAILYLLMPDDLWFLSAISIKT